MSLCAQCGCGFHRLEGDGEPGCDCLRSECGCRDARESETDTPGPRILTQLNELPGESFEEIFQPPEAA